MTPKTKTRKIDWKAEVDKVDPKRNEPTIEYRFSNGRKFKRRTQDSDLYS